MAYKKLTKGSGDENCQRVVCFTETPLENVSLLAEHIDGREMQFSPYGIAISRKQGRKRGVNPVWYLDITPGHDWLTQPINTLIQEAIDKGQFKDQPISKISPFLEQMGTHTSGIEPWEGSYRKEFWWEREWRHTGNFDLPTNYIILCPSSEILTVKAAIDELDEFDRPNKVSYIDPRWSLEMIIGKLAGFGSDELGAF